MTKWKIHPVAAMFPLLRGDELTALIEDVQENGFREPVVTYQGEILDGQNRLQVAEALGVTPEFWEYEGDDPVGFIISANLRRRQLNVGQKALIGDSMLDYFEKQNGQRKGGRPTKKPETTLSQVSARLPQSRAQAAQVVGVGEISVGKAKKLRPHQDLREAVRSGDRDLESAYKDAKQRERLDTTRVQIKRKPMQPSSRPVFNYTTDLVSWANWTWNPVTGCEHNCPYCYARDIAERMQDRGIPQYAKGFEPAFHENQLQAPYNTSHPADADLNDWRENNVFVTSMGDLFGKWVPQDWIDRVLEVERDTPQWTYLHLSKFPSRLASITWPTNTWVGTTVDTQRRVSIAESAFRKIKCGIKWLSCEPLLEPVKFTSLEMFDLVVIGAQTLVPETREFPESPGFAPDFEWVASLVSQAREAGCAIYMKENLQTSESPDPWEYPGMYLIQEMPPVLSQHRASVHKVPATGDAPVAYFASCPVNDCWEEEFDTQIVAQRAANEHRKVYG